jgi:hypothetical protein
MNREIVLRREWPLLSGGMCRTYEYVPSSTGQAQGNEAVWTFEWTSRESLDDIIVEAEQDVAAHTAWLEHLKNLRDTE